MQSSPATHTRSRNQSSLAVRVVRCAVPCVVVPSPRPFPSLLAICWELGSWDTPPFPHAPLTDKNSWGMSTAMESESHAMMDAFVAAGGNFIDTGGVLFTVHAVSMLGLQGVLECSSDVCH